VRERAEGRVPLASKLGLVEVRAGNVEAGLQRLRRALTQEPKRAELYDRLIAAHVELGQLDEAAAVVERKLEVTGPHPDSFLKLASIRAQQGDWRQAGCALRAGLHYSPDLEKLRLALAEVQAHESSQTSP
jgi:tetratricopeptide (TPR) repeat protein